MRLDESIDFCSVHCEPIHWGLLSEQGRDRIQFRTELSPSGCWVRTDGLEAGRDRGRWKSQPRGGAPGGSGEDSGKSAAPGLAGS